MNAGLRASHDLRMMHAQHRFLTGAALNIRHARCSNCQSEPRAVKLDVANRSRPQ